jgi:hypothetical protein
MRAAQAIRLVSALTLVLGCSDTTGPGPDPVDPADPALLVAPTGASIGRGESIRFTATPRGSAAALLSGDAPVTWFSSDNSVATVDADGIVRGVNTGTAMITAILRGARGSTRITVVGMRKKGDGTLPCFLADHPTLPTC